jgi:hypothetical protein
MCGQPSIVSPSLESNVRLRCTELGFTFKGGAKLGVTFKGRAYN